ncbi:uncharacterized protein J4E78_007417 [Alternaria triticimaculans]|uniref:uncharacterized protein n=1 Tax=Alternaria triticimaculans TaxID=297637 RepID=UPI0020C26BB0|nr:uncharacterized protein J4E78_007417 [Alternaria triticimaculans]KAI4654371.1 hypothetical protein J4E78_007417 [Alternaria triticimaculans]
MIAPINQETGEVHGSHFAKLAYTNVDFSTPSSASKDTSRTTLPIRSLGDRHKPPVFGEPTPLKSRVLKPTVYEPPAYQPSVYTSPKSASDAWIQAPPKTISRASGYESTQLDGSPGLRARLATIRDLRQRKYTDAEIDKMVANMGNVGLSFPELLEMLRNGPQTETSTKKAERAQSKVGPRPTTSTTPTTPAKRDVPTYSLNPSDVEGRRTQLPIRSQKTTKPIKSRFAVEKLASVQTEPAARAELDRVLAMDNPKAPEEEVPEDQFETLNLDSDEEEWDKIDADDEWEVVDDPRAEVEKNAV